MVCLGLWKGLSQEQSLELGFTWKLGFTVHALLSRSKWLSSVEDLRAQGQPDWCGSVLRGDLNDLCAVPIRKRDDERQIHEAFVLDHRERSLGLSYGQTETKATQAQTKHWHRKLVLAMAIHLSNKGERDRDRQTERQRQTERHRDRDRDWERERGQYITE